MLDLQKTAREIGLFEVGINLSRVSGSEDVYQKAGASMPLPGEDIEDRIGQIASWLHSFGKSKYLFLSPELALIEALASLEDEQTEVIIAIPCDLDDDAKSRLRNNLPRGIKVSILEEPFFPQAFFPSNGMIVVSGYSAGGRPMVLYDTFRMVEHYSGFHGKKVFVPFTELDAAERYDGWMEVGQQRISMKWRNEA